MIQGIIFDLDGVIVATDEFHYRGWQRLADEEGVYFDRTINLRLRGVSRMGSLDILLERAARRYTAAEKETLAARKNGYYRALLPTLTPADLLPGVRRLLDELRARGVKQAIGSSSRNCPAILEYIGLATFFDAVVDGNDIHHGKPDPEVFLLAAQALGLPPAACLVVEDAEAGVSAGLAGGMLVLAVGAAASDPRAHARAPDLSGLSASDLLAIGAK